MIPRVLIFLIPLSFAFGQNLAGQFNAAPPEVDQALRARITKYYQAFVDGKFRAADQVVADESQDAFFAMEKDQYKRFQILRIQYSDNFTKAQAVVSVKTEWAFHGERMPVTAPMTSHWELKDGQWWWYLPHADVTETPFGGMRAGPDHGPTGSGFPIPPDPSKLTQQILNQVQIDKKEVAIDNSKPARSGIKVLSHAPGKVRLKVDGVSYPGLTLSLEKTELGANESTTLWVSYEPPKNALAPVGSVTLHITVLPSGTSLPLRVDFAPPAQAAR